MADNFYIIEDNFFKDPHRVRGYAIQSLMDKHDCILNDSTNNYPGIRSEVPQSIADEIIFFINKSFQKKPKDFNSNFHITSRIHEVGLIHNDIKTFAGLIYLSENPPPKSGTILCIPNDENKPPEGFHSASTTHNINVIERFADYKKEFNKNFEIKVELENKFNRLVIYNGQQLHAPYHYFGNNLFNSRLVLVFWFQF